MNNSPYPLGSIVSINNDTARVIIAGYGIRDNKNNNSYEYCGFEIPLGYDPDHTYLFNEENINYIIFIGHDTKEKKDFRKKIGEHYKKNPNIFLPIGSYVTIGTSEELMIIGFGILNVNDKKIYDYCAIDDEQEIYYFNKEDIEDIIYIGYFNDDSKAYINYLNDVLDDVKLGKDILPYIEEKLKSVKESDKK